ncbi:MAG TPA: Asp-tRNA(Asn)/Glu-tRNA(Gln) amidotransferase subunit GatA [Steroidobacteraceae bacterium]|nr:Asp-tRNA(Asn)/Glu-tRNA(Gln) amidotransferase subunit GatA [Steroidobacteraceae bacterium]
MTLHTRSVAELAAGLAAKQFSAVELAQHYLARIEAGNPALNAFVTISAERALADARRADAARAAGRAGPLTGVPLAHKDIFCTDGIRTTCGSKMLDTFVAPYDATVAERLQVAGTVLLGKTNMDEFAMGSSNETSYYGAVKNPWNLRKVPGGSSGGSAAAVAARLAPVATGTDTGGSIRQPAALVGISGLKPTYGRVSRYGMVAFASSLDQAGILAPSAEDCAILLGAIAGFDPRDSTSVDRPVPDYLAELRAPLKGVRLGLLKEFLEGGLEAATGALVQAAIAELQSLGATLVDVSCPSLPLSVPAYYVVAPAECSSNLSRFDGIRFGHRCKQPRDLLDLYRRSRGEGFGAEVKRRIMTGTYVLSAGYYDAYYLKAQKVRSLISAEFKQAFTRADVLVGPTAPTPAFDIGAKVDDPITMYLNDIYTIGANLAGLPAMSVPCGFVDDLPVGLQLVGPHFGESRILAAAHAYQLATDFHRRLPASCA